MTRLIGDTVQPPAHHWITLRTVAIQNPNLGGRS